MNYKLILFFIFLFLVNFSVTPAFLAISIADDESRVIENAKLIVKSALKDPESAQFRELRIVVNGRAVESVCGEVNARNSFGGYNGFSEFNVTGNFANIVAQDYRETFKLYKLSGCAGPKAELEVRLEDEAEFNCTVIWTLLKNVIVENRGKEESIEAAIIATKNRAKDNGGEISDDQIEVIRTEYMKSLEQIFSDKKQVKAIKSNPGYQGMVFVPACSANSLNILKKQFNVE